MARRCSLGSIQSPLLDPRRSSCPAARRACASLAHALAVLVAVAFVLSARVASADPKIDALVKQLAADDFRIRTQAALGLGASRDPAAVKPLCGAIGDGNASVKLAVVAALGKLGRDEGAACLKSAKAAEKDASALKAIDASLEKIVLGGDPPPPAPGAKLYVAIQVTNKTGRPNLEVEGIVRKAMQAKLLASSCAVAPRTETVQQAKDVIGSKKLSGYLLMASVEPFNYGGGNLTVQLKVTMWTYPDKALKAEFGPKLTQQGTTKSDLEGENLLMQMAGETAAQSFVKVAASL